MNSLCFSLSICIPSPSELLYEALSPFSSAFLVFPTVLLERLTAESQDVKEAKWILIKPKMVSVPEILTKVFRAACQVWNQSKAGNWRVNGEDEVESFGLSGRNQLCEY
ncbi:hypothetical protein RJT34_19346 [Clitoria ternatea]|uniref:Uncharacterized protein n=1 Tax=Clitoria ternatea TaxID=43366 RepID=A0AAN9P3K8_CLITE